MAKSSKAYKSRRPEKEYQEEVLEISRVTRVVSGGRRLRFRVTVVIGNQNGKVGVGVGKAGEVIVAIQKAVQNAKKNMITVASVEDTIIHPIKHKYKSANILLMPAGPGTGIIAGGAIRKVVELAGIKNILSKSFGTSNKIATARATVQALKQLTKAADKHGVADKKEEKKKPAPKTEARKDKKEKVATKKPAPKNTAEKKETPKKATPKTEAKKES